jgi:hypothetical protein
VFEPCGGYEMVSQLRSHPAARSLMQQRLLNWEIPNVPDKNKNQSNKDTHAEDEN